MAASTKTAKSGPRNEYQSKKKWKEGKSEVTVMKGIFLNF